VNFGPGGALSFARAPNFPKPARPELANKADPKGSAFLIRPTFSFRFLIGPSSKIDA
jgi:hypothetical protein